MVHAGHILALTAVCLPGLMAEKNNTSKEPVHFRLVGGASRCEGRLQVKWQNRYWRQADGFYWNLKLGNRVCAELNCGSAVVVTRPARSSRMNVWWFKSDCNNSSFSDCLRVSRSTLSVELKCLDSVRLVHGSSLCSGRLEVQSNDSWSSVCEGHFDLHDAKVVCSELGCGAPSLLQGTLYGEAKAPLWKVFQCKGYESALLDCGTSVSANCSSGKAVELTCRDPGYARLVGGASRCNGTVQVKHHRVWRDMAYIPYDYRPNPWTLKAADILCSQLDCGSAVSVRQKNASSYPLWEISSSCVEMTSTLRDCATPLSVFYKSFTMFLTCSDSVRLVHGSSVCSGRLEVQSNQSWSSVCEEDFDYNDAEVVCRELGCGAPLLLQGAPYGEGEDPVWTSELQCEGNESALLDCRRSSSAGKTCSPGKAAGLTCADPGDVRLVGQPSRCAGTLEIQHQGQWRPVLVPYENWDQKSGSAVCQHLNCGSAVSVKKRRDSSNRLSWFLSPSCVKQTSGLKDCVGLDGSFNGSSRVDIVCSDLLSQPNISLFDGFFEAYKQGCRLLIGSDFTIRCSQPQYAGGSFQLMSNSKKAQNHTVRAFNHSAHFSLSAVGFPHRGDYICVYHLDVFNHSFSSCQSAALYLTVGGSVTHLIIRVVLIVSALLIFDISLFYYYKVSVRRIRMKVGH